MSRILRTLDRVKATAYSAATTLGRAGLFVALAVFGGIGTSWYMSTNASMLTTEAYGPWVTWVSAGRQDADPYTRARFARLGSLPINSASALTLEALTDNTGQRLHSACEYVIEGRMPEAQWWSIAVYTDRGQLIANPAERHTFNSSTIAPNPDGSILVALARDARPGNWLPTGGGGRLAVILTVHQSVQQAGAGPRVVDQSITLPTIRRIECR